MNRLINYDRNASQYDRRHGRFLAGDELDRLVQVTRLSAPSTVLEVAVGTGRVSIPLANRGFRVIGLDRSHGMLSELEQKEGRRLVLRIRGDARQIPISDEAIDAVVIARLLYLIPEWELTLREAIRVLRRDGVILHEWGNGSPDEAWVIIREKARELFEAEGIRDPFHPGARTEEEVDRFLRSRGASRRTVPLGPSKVLVSPTDFLRRVIQGECSYTWDIPDAVLKRCWPTLEEWAVDTLKAVDEPQPLPQEVRWRVYRFAD